MMSKRFLRTLNQRLCGGRVRRVLNLVGPGFCLIAAAELAPWRVGIVSGSSMTPTLRPGSAFIYQRLSAADSLRAGDIVVVRINGVPCVKRIYATGGRSFWTWRQPLEGQIRHDPISAAQRSRFEKIAAAERASCHEDVRVQQLRVPSGDVFLVGDGIYSEDSRQFGPVDAAQILGRVVALPGQRLDPPARGVELSFPPGSRAPRIAAGSRRASPGCGRRPG